MNYEEQWMNCMNRYERVQRECYPMVLSIEQLLQNKKTIEQICKNFNKNDYYLSLDCLSKFLTQLNLQLRDTKTQQSFELLKSNLRIEFQQKKQLGSLLCQTKENLNPLVSVILSFNDSELKQIYVAYSVVHRFQFLILNMYIEKFINMKSLFYSVELVQRNWPAEWRASEIVLDNAIIDQIMQFNQFNNPFKNMSKTKNSDYITCRVFWSIFEW